MLAIQDNDNSVEDTDVRILNADGSFNEAPAPAATPPVEPPAGIPVEPPGAETRRAPRHWPPSHRSRNPVDEPAPEEPPLDETPIEEPPLEDPVDEADETDDRGRPRRRRDRLSAPTPPPRRGAAMNRTEPLAAVDTALAAIARYERPDLDDRLRQARSRLLDDRVRVLVVGEFKQGKSMLVNGLVGAPVCPTFDDVATAVPTGSGTPRR